MTLDPCEFVEKFGVVRQDNYLAHTIRAIEGHIVRIARSYHIFTMRSQVKDSTTCQFFDRGCIIRLPEDVEDRDACEIRLRLAHELGHILWVANKLRNPETLKEATEEEEVFAWEFAFRLIMRKSEDYADPHYKKFVFKQEKVKATIEGILARDKRGDREGKIWSLVARRLS